MDSPAIRSPALPRIIQGGMGVGVSTWRLARTVACCGQLGVVSGTALNSVLIRRLQDGDPAGRMRHALAHCPLRDAAQEIVDRYFLAGGRPAGRPYRLSPLFSLQSPRALLALTAVAAFAEVFLAKEGHGGPVGINLLEKIQLPTLPTLFGAMLADVDHVLMGAGIPRAIPGVLDRFARWEPAELRVDIHGAAAGVEHRVSFDPRDYLAPPRPELRRPAFLGIVSSSALATTLARKSSGRVDGFIVEDATAGGHNAPPRGPLQLSADGEPLYGPRDNVDLAAIRALGLPFWLAGSCGTPARLEAALAAGAAGVQIGTAFAFCEESGLDPSLKLAALHASDAGSLRVRTDPRASPTGLPFKVVNLPGTLADEAVCRARSRACDLGYLRQPYLAPDGSIGYRCPGEPESDYARKGGNPADTAGRKCLCNGLMATAGLGQTLPAGDREPALVTAGESVGDIRAFVPAGRSGYTAADVIAFIGTA